MNGRERTKARANEVRVIARELGASNKVARLLSMVATRESKVNPGKRHKKQADLDANRRSYKKRKHIYVEAGNTTVEEFELWSTGLGLFGSNVALWLHSWDPKASPEVLCDPWIAIATYLRKMQRARKAYLGQLPHGERRVFCNGERYRGGYESHSKTPVLMDLHGYVSGGYACPKASDSPRRQNTEHRMHRNGLNPYYPLKKSELGYELSNSEVLELKKRFSERKTQRHNDNSSNIIWFVYPLWNWVDCNVDSD